METFFIIISLLLTLFALIHSPYIENLIYLLLVITIILAILVPQNIRNYISFGFFTILSNPFVLLVIIGFITKQLTLIF